MQQPQIPPKGGTGTEKQPDPGMPSVLIKIQKDGGIYIETQFGQTINSKTAEYIAALVYVLCSGHLMSDILKSIHKMGYIRKQPEFAQHIIELVQIYFEKAHSSLPVVLPSEVFSQGQE